VTAGIATQRNATALSAGHTFAPFGQLAAGGGNAGGIESQIGEQLAPLAVLDEAIGDAERLMRLVPRPNRKPLRGPRCQSPSGSPLRL
jgi:hypothetical protein